MGKMMGAISDLVSDFVSSVESGSVDIYNEFSLQHELGIFLRARLPDYRVYFERNVSSFFSTKTPFTKREIDISICSPDLKELKYAIELKYPRNGQHPEQMFSFCRDIAFAEELHRSGFVEAALAIFVDDPLFYSGASDGIYGFFRGGRPICGRVQKPTGTRLGEVEIRGTYSVQWRPLTEARRYTVIEVGS
jgi:hypothetical protein